MVQLAFGEVVGSFYQWIWWRNATHTAISKAVYQVKIR